jgi:adenylosuccinate synthase
LAKKHTGILVVGLDSDQTLKTNKGPSRPINNFRLRSQLLSEIDLIDYIFKIDKKIVFSQVPSGALNPNVKLLIGNGCVLNLSKLREEIQNLESLGISVKDRLFISDKAHVVQESHIEDDRIVESTSYAIGSTKQGIGPCYESKVGRRGTRMCDFEKSDLMLDQWGAWSYLQPMICDTSDLLHKFIKEGKKVLCEGAQGTFLDIDHGSYPFVTSSNTIAGAACCGLGFSPLLVNKVIGITKAYVTRVGLGSLATELNTDSGPGKIIAENGHEFGSVTGRPRRIGWLNLVELKKAIQLNGCSEIILTKLDVLSSLNYISICSSYNFEEPVYDIFEGWNQDISQM